MRKSASACSAAMPPTLSAPADRPFALGRLRALLHTWRQRRALRRKLAELDEHLLRDIGWSAAAAAAESRKPFWRP